MFNLSLPLFRWTVLALLLVMSRRVASGRTVQKPKSEFIRVLRLSHCIDSWHSMDGRDESDETPRSGETAAEQAPPSVAETSVEVESCDRLEGCDALGKAISSTLGSVMKEFDSRAEGAIQSQDELTRSIDQLTGELDKLLEDAPLPFVMQHAMKISSIRRRVSSLNLILKSIQRRIDNIDRMLSTGVPSEKVPADIVSLSWLTL